MAENKKAAPTDADLDALFQGIGEEDTAVSGTTTSNAKKTTTPAKQDTGEDNPFADLESQLNAPRTSTSSRPGTPRVVPSSASTSTRTRSPTGRKPEIYTPTTGSGRSSEERVTGTAHLLQDPQRTPSASQQQQQQQQPPAATKPAPAASSWWGGLSAMASAAVKQAENAVKEIQKNEEAIKWAEQVRENYGALRGLGGEIRSRAMPTFSNILQTLAPPISQHERLQIHITHDLVNYPALDPIIYQTFSRVMSQVEGGDLMVIQRGSESAQRRSNSNTEAGYTGNSLGGSTGWGDGPWWRQENSHRNLGVVKGLVEGTKLVRASAEAYGTEFFAARGGIEEAAKQATVVLNEDNPVRSSDIFIAIQAVGHTTTTDYFASGLSAPSDSKEEHSVVEEAPKPDELVSFAIYLHDPIHSIAFSTLSQAFPQKWADWIDAESSTPAQQDEDGNMIPMSDLPDEILEIIKTGGVDPREWIAEWLEEILSLSVGVVAQRYVARRMGVGEGGIGRGKRREHVEESGGGEAARAL